MEPFHGESFTLLQHIEGIYTHFCCPYDAGALRYSRQLFNQVLQMLESQGVEFGVGKVLRHASASATVFTRGAEFDMVRVGSLLFGAKADLVLEEGLFWDAVAANGGAPGGETRNAAKAGVEGHLPSNLLSVSKEKYFYLLDYDGKGRELARRHKDADGNRSSHEEVLTKKSDHVGAVSDEQTPPREERSADVEADVDAGFRAPSLSTLPLDPEHADHSMMPGPQNALSWRTTVTSLRTVAEQNFDGTKPGERYGPCLSYSGCLGYPVLPPGMVVANVPVGFDEYGSDRTLFCSNRKKNVDEISGRRQRRICHANSHLFNTPTTGTIEVAAGGGQLREGDEIILCQAERSCEPMLLNIASQVARVVVE